MVKLSGSSKILLVQIVLDSDYSGSVKELQWLLQPISRKGVWKKSHNEKNNRKEEHK